MWFWHLLGERARAALVGAAGGGSTARPPSRTALERAVGHDLAKLHLPVLAGVAQGPGFPNLSSWSARRPRARRLRPPSLRRRPLATAA
jgi:mycobactin lysine-N-oxygenase